MKKHIIALAAVVLALAACEKPVEKVQIPELINATFTTLTNKSVEAGQPNKLTVTAADNGAEISFVFYTDKVYLDNAVYTVGTAAGNYTAHYKDQYVDNDVVSGSVTVTADDKDNYTITGALKLNNEEETLVKVNATGVMVYELPAEYVYTKATKDGATVYTIYTLGDTNEMLAMATVYGDALGTFEVNTSGAAGSAAPGYIAESGTFISIDIWGYFMQFSGTVTISEKAGKLNFVFEGANKGAYRNCQEVAKANVPAYTTPKDGFYVYKYFFAPSQLVDNVFECTVKVYTSDLKEIVTGTFLIDNQDFYKGENQGKGLGYMVYGLEYYSAQTVGKVAFNNGTYMRINGESTVVPNEYYFVVNDKSETKYYAMAAPIDATYTAPEPLMGFLDNNIWSFAAFTYEYYLAAIGAAQ